MITCKQLCEEANLLAKLANDNLASLEGCCSDKIETQDYYLGILRRQAILHLDLVRLFESRNSELITTPFILFRSLMDDFLHLLYLELHAERDEEIIKINANTHRQSFNSIEGLAKSNHKYFEGKYPYYLNNEQLLKLKETFAKKSENDKYFIDKDQFRFKKFMSLSQVAESITQSRDLEIYKDRAYYLWKEFSSFVHYSSSSFYLETNSNPLNLNKMEEAFQYCYNSIYLSFRFFTRTKDIEFIDNTDLRGRHGILLEC